MLDSLYRRDTVSHQGCTIDIEHTRGGNRRISACGAFPFRGDQRQREEQVAAAPADVDVGTMHFVLDPKLRARDALAEEYPVRQTTGRLGRFKQLIVADRPEMYREPVTAGKLPQF